MGRLCGLFILEETARQMIYGPTELRDIARHVDLYCDPQTRASVAANPAVLAQADVIFSGWGGPVLDERFLDAANRLAVLFYGAGAVGGIITPAAWKRGVIVTSAYAANAIPVAEYTLATIILSLKHAWHLSRQTHQLRRFVPRDGAPGCYGRIVGLISMGMVAHTVVKMLKAMDLRVIAYDPFLSDTDAQSLGVEKVSIEDLFSRSDVVSLHAPQLPETTGMITGGHIASMKQGATFINTARGSIVCEREMIDVLQRRPDLCAVLDVTAEEPPAPESPLYTMPNVVLTPHIAGSVGQECQRMGRYMVEELERYVSGKPLRWVVTPELAANSTHRPACLSKPQPHRKPVAV